MKGPKAPHLNGDVPVWWFPGCVPRNTGPWEKGLPRPHEFEKCRNYISLLVTPSEKSHRKDTCLISFSAAVPQPFGDPFFPSQIRHVTSHRTHWESPLWARVTRFALSPVSIYLSAILENCLKPELSRACAPVRSPRLPLGPDP